MDKKALLDYALFARKELETQIGLSLNKLGIYKDHITKANIVGDYTIIEGNPESFPKRVFELRKTIIGTYFKDEKFDNVVEEFAYTWFNRIIALRFMEVHDYFSHGFRVLTSRDGSYEPEIITNIYYVIDELHLEKSVVDTLKEQGKSEELYRYVLFKQCNALSSIFPELFTKQDSYLELLLPNNLLSQDSVIRKITMIPEEDFLNDVEVVGWLYQYYVASNREEFRKAKIVTKELIPTLSEVFTPDWIVRYMADNSVGRLWLESYPNSSIKDSLKYYVDDVEQDDETKKKLEEIRYKNVNPEEIKIIEPCCGSGHILVYVFDLLLKMYVEKGYNKKDAPSLILKNNLYGLDVDKRAAQLAQFSLIMKARSIDNRFFNEDRFIYPHVYEIKDSLPLIESNYQENMKSLNFSGNSIKQVEYLAETFRYGKVIGSLLRVENKDYSELVDDIKRCCENETPNLFETDFFNDGIQNIRSLITLSRLLSRKYDIMITNPPYLSNSNLEESAKKYTIKYYPNSKSDMFGMFMETQFVRNNGFRAMVNPDSWMFLKSFSNMRKDICSKKNIVCLLHIGMGAFDAVVQTVSFVLRNCFLPSFKAEYYRMVGCFDSAEPFASFSNAKQYISTLTTFQSLPLMPIAYWTSKTIKQLFTNKPLEETAEPKQGLATGDNDTFLRFWYEISLDKSSIGGRNADKAKWFPCNKGGEFRRWYGNNYWVVNYENNGSAVSANFGSRFQNSRYYLRQGLTWSSLSSSKLSMRFCPSGYVFETKGSMLFLKDEKYTLYVLGFMNSCVVNYLLLILSPTLDYHEGPIGRLPLIIDETAVPQINSLVKENISLSTKEWNKSEISWEFAKHFLVKNDSQLLSDIFAETKKEFEDNHEAMIKNEESINDSFVRIYHIESENLETKVEENYVTYQKVSYFESIRSLISYFIGLLMGRYSLEQEGLVYAGGTFDKSKYGDYVDDDGVLPIYQFIGIDNGLTSSICKLVKRIYGDTYYRENLDFIAEALGRKPEEGAEDTINRYLNDSFYNDHLKTYQKRPIYWMLSSGKQGAFKCLVYLHRYNKNTLALINTKYFLPRTAMYKSERERLTDQLSRADIREKKKIEQQLAKVEACEEELLEYGQVLDHMANQYIDIDLDDGVKVNYCKFQGISLEVNGATVKKNLLVPFGLEEKK